MRKLKVGIWLNSDHLIPESGGSYGFYKELLKALGEYSFKDAEIVFLSNKKMNLDHLEIKIIKGRAQRSIILKAMLLVAVIIRSNSFFKNFVKIIEKMIEKIFDRTKNEIYQYVDIIYYLTPNCIYPEIPYIFTLWDLGHFNCYAFPEVNMNGIFEYRRKKQDVLCSKALMIFAESETGKKQCAKYLNINEKRIKAIPIFPSEVVTSKCSSQKPAKIIENEFFIHYPAQYWAHKNHYNLLVAMLSIIKIFPNLKLILTGSDKGNKDYILEIIKELHLEKNVIDLGFVSFGELRWLYENSQGLVMPTLLGPTNMPLLEAAELGCPVACTNLPGHIEQLGDYGYYFDGINAEDIADKIIAMIKDKKSGITKNYNSKFNIKNTLKSIDKAFTELKNIRFCWGKGNRIA